METFWNSVAQLENYIDIMYLSTFMFFGYLIKCYMKKLICKFFHRDIKFVFIILILAAIVAIPFLIDGVSWQKILLSYALGTSLHETIFTYFEKKTKKNYEKFIKK